VILNRVYKKSLPRKGHLLKDKEDEEAGFLNI
jgi:hypothetical protein